MPERVEPKRAGQTHIEAITRDGTHHHFTPRVLDVMLERDQVMRFKRSSGWVTVGVDPVRAKRSSGDSFIHDGWERRCSTDIVCRPPIFPQRPILGLADT
jgi:hypothetical protein